MCCCPTNARTIASMIRHRATRSCTQCPQVTSNLFCSPGSTPSCECGRKARHKKELRKGAFDHHDTLETWMPGVVVMGLFCTFLLQSKQSQQSRSWLVAMTFKTDDPLYCFLWDQIYSDRTFLRRRKIQQLCLIHYALDLRRYLLRWTPWCMVLASSINFIKDYWYVFGSCKIKASHDY
jgi:hypothetical protein